ncbi:MAG: RNA polymerase sigma factor [Akkermansiaceae bacterium]
MPPRSDSDLVLAALADGSEAASARDEIIHRYHGKIYAFLFKLTGKREDAEDLTQDTLLLALRKLKTFKAGHQLLPWLFTIARRTAISQWRKSKPSVTLLDSDHPSTESDRPHDAIALWKIAKKSLNPNEFTALWMHYQEGLPLKEVARILGKTAPHAKVILFRARKRLGNELLSTGEAWLPGQTVNLTSP